MRRSRLWCYAITLMVPATAVPGCGGRGGVPKLSFNVSQAADAALAEFDANHDGALAGTELAACPGIQGALTNFDKNGDSRVDGEELRNRFQVWLDSPTRVTMPRCVVKLDGQPLSNAVVEFVPEKILAVALLPGSGTTGEDGMCGISIQPSDASQGPQLARGVRLGLYRVSITHPTAKIPAKYNTQTTLGVEVSPASSGSPITFSISSR
jgi:hypothetical protein